MRLNWFISMMLICGCLAKDLLITEVQNTFRNALNPRVKVVKSLHGTVRYSDGVLILKCNSAKPLSESFSALNYKPVKFLLIECSLEPIPLKEQLLKINVTTDELEAIQISIFIETFTEDTKPLPTGNYTEGLTIKHLVISHQTPISVNATDYLRNNPDFLKPLVNLTTLTCELIKLPTIPTSIKQLKGILLFRSNFTTTKWEGCQNLEELNIMGSYGKKSSMNVPKEWPDECNKLKSLTVQNLKTDVVETILASMAKAVSLEYLNLEGNDLENIPAEILQASGNTLTELHLPNNKLSDDAMTKLTDSNNLTKLVLSENLLDGTKFHEWSKKLKSLKILDLNDNKLTPTFCYLTSLYASNISENLPSLERLSLDKMKDINPHCLKNVFFSKLNYLKLASEVKIEDLILQELPKTNSTHLEVLLRDLRMQRVKFYYQDYISLINGNFSGFWGTNTYSKANLTIDGATLECDCENYWLARATRESIAFPFKLSVNFECTNNQDFKKEPLETMDCTKHYPDPFGCVGRIIGTPGSERWETNTQIFDCHNVQGELNYNLFERERDVISLNFTDNQITTVRNFKIPDSVQWIDLRRNAISRLDVADTDKLFSRNNLKVWLSKNLFVCDCDNKHLIDTLQEYRDQIPDYDDILCLDNGQPLSSTSSYEVCQIGFKILLGILACLLVLAVTAGAFMWRYRFKIKIYLYSRGMCLSCLREEDLDADRPFDAFLSFAHGDATYVVENLLQKLEGNPDNYRILIHFRDWVIGDWIPAQIMKSIQLSKRTIIVLSRNFVGSMWGSLEFKYAVASAAQEGKRRLLVLILDDVLTLPLDPELKAYIEYNTYLTCDDPWFWEKLRYAMPHKKQIGGNEDLPFQDPQVQVETPSVHELDSLRVMDT